MIGTRSKRVLDWNNFRMRMAPPSTVTVIILTTNMVFIQTELRREYNSQKILTPWFIMVNEYYSPVKI